MKYMLLVLIMLASGCSSTTPNRPTAATAPTVQPKQADRTQPVVPVEPSVQEASAAERVPPAGLKWYQGGTLHRKSALEWQTATAADKLATCADFVTGMWQDGNLKPAVANRLLTVDDVRPYAQELLDFLDAALEPDPDPAQNRRLYANQSVSYFAAVGMVMMGWAK